jgi:hypothetical protein
MISPGRNDAGSKLTTQIKGENTMTTHTIKMEDSVSQAKAEYLRAKGRLVVALDTTPDDKLNWSPSASARTPVELVAHAASAVALIQGAISGALWPYASLTEADAAFRVDDKQFKTREQAKGHIEETSNKFIAWLDSLTPEQVGSTVQMIFGSFPVGVAITFAADHMRGHTAQIEYIQTIWGDYDWHVS